MKVLLCWLWFWWFCSILKRSVSQRNRNSYWSTGLPTTASPSGSRGLRLLQNQKQTHQEKRFTVQTSGFEFCLSQPFKPFLINLFESFHNSDHHRSILHPRWLFLDHLSTRWSFHLVHLNKSTLYMKLFLLYKLDIHKTAVFQNNKPR